MARLTDDGRVIRSGTGATGFGLAWRYLREQSEQRWYERRDLVENMKQRIRRT